MIKKIITIILFPSIFLGSQINISNPVQGKINHKKLEVTEKDAAIFRTKEGELYNVAVIDEASDLNLEKTKVKRENKAYSIKEQLAEIELRKELARKNRETGKLTEKQKVAMEKELKKERFLKFFLK